MSHSLSPSLTNKEERRERRRDSCRCLNSRSVKKEGRRSKCLLFFRRQKVLSKVLTLREREREEGKKEKEERKRKKKRKRKEERGNSRKRNSRAKDVNLLFRSFIEQYHNMDVTAISRSFSSSSAFSLLFLRLQTWKCCFSLWMESIENERNNLWKAIQLLSEWKKEEGKNFFLISSSLSDRRRREKKRKKEKNEERKRKEGRREKEIEKDETNMQIIIRNSVQN